jgi:hypothetical protein
MLPEEERPYDIIVVAAEHSEKKQSRSFFPKDRAKQHNNNKAFAALLVLRISIHYTAATKA